MPAAGDPVFASDVLRARPKHFFDAASGTFGASQTGVAVPGISIAFTTETAGADLDLSWTVDADLSGASTATLSARPQIVGSGTAAAYGTQVSPVLAVYGAEVATDRSTVAGLWSAPLGPAGTYTITLLGTTAANQTFNIYTALLAVLNEQFA